MVSLERWVGLEMGMVQLQRSASGEHHFDAIPTILTTPLSDALGRGVCVFRVFSYFVILRAIDRADLDHFDRVLVRLRGLWAYGWTDLGPSWIDPLLMSWGFC
jgi:hypothetical protein